MVSDYSKHFTISIVLLLVITIVVNNAWAEMTKDEVSVELDKIENMVSKINKKVDTINPNKIGSLIFEFGQIRNAFIELHHVDTEDFHERDPFLKAKYDYYGNLTDELSMKFREDLRESLTDGTETMQKRIFYNKFFQSEVESNMLLKSIEQTKRAKELIKSEFEKLENKRKVQELLHKIALDDELNPSNYREEKYLEQAIDVIFEKEQWDLMPIVLEKFDDQFANPEIKKRVFNRSQEILDRIEKLTKPSYQVTFVNGTAVMVEAGGILSSKLKQDIEASTNDLQSIKNEINQEYESQLQEIRKSDDSTQTTSNDNGNGNGKGKGQQGGGQQGGGQQGGGQQGGGQQGGKPNP